MEAMAQPKYKGKRYRLDKPELLARRVIWKTEICGALWR